GVTQPGATRAAAQLAEDGLVAITQARDDQRRKSVALAAAGKRLVARGKRTAWPLIERAVRDLCEELEGSLLEQLAALEDGLAAEPLERRIARPVGRRVAQPIARPSARTRGSRR